MTDTQALRDLLEKVEAGSYGDGHTAFKSLGDPYQLSMHAYRAFSGSLDAAKALHEALLPGWGWTLEFDEQAVLWRRDANVEIYGLWCSTSNPARAWLIAILKALLSEQEGSE